MEYTFRKATLADLDSIMNIIGEAKAQMAREGKHQWNGSYPERPNIENDIQTGAAHVIAYADQLLAYGATVFTGEPAYDDIQGHWLSVYIRSCKKMTCKAKKCSFSLGGG